MEKELSFKGYKVGDKIVGLGTSSIYEVFERAGELRLKCVKSYHEDVPEGKDCGHISSFSINHEKSAKLNSQLPQPHKNLLKSGMTVEFGNGERRYVLIETDSLHDEYGTFKLNISKYSSDLSNPHCIDRQFDVAKIWDGEILVAQRELILKTEAELKKEELMKLLEDLEGEFESRAKEIKNRMEKL